MKVLTTTGLSKLIELSKDTFVDKTDTTQVSLVTLANVATTGDYNDLLNKPSASDLLPSQSGNSGKFLTTNGTTPSWSAVDALPSQSGQSGKYLTTNGTSASWATIAAYTNGAGISLAGTTFSANCDTTTVSTNSSSKLQAIGVVDKQSSGAVYTWKGTLAQYNALSTKNNNWIYYITDDGAISTEDYYTKAQIDAMLLTNHQVIGDTAKVIIKDTNTDADITNTPATTNHNGGLVQFQDKNGETSGYLYTSYKTDGNIEQVVEVNREVNNEIVTNSINIGIDSSGNKYVNVVKPAASSDLSNTNVATVGWVNDPVSSTNVVHRTGTETISGTKVFTANNTHSGNNVFSGDNTFSGTTNCSGSLRAHNDCGFGTVIDTDDYTNTPESQINGAIGVWDKNGQWLGGWEHYHKVDGTYTKQMAVRQQDGSNYGILSVSIDPSGNAWCNLPTDTYGTNYHGTTFNGTTFTGTSNRALYADLAENYESDEKYPIGTLICFGGEKDITVAKVNCNGVISEKPGYLLDSDLENGLPVALAGKTPIRILGKVRKFDRIVLDLEHPGLGKAQVTSDEKVIAIALESSDDSNIKLVKCVTKFNLD